MTSAKMDEREHEGEQKMAYTAEISRGNPSCFFFIIDQSGSMQDAFGGESAKKKADGVADAINRLLQNLRSWGSCSNPYYIR